MMPMNRYPRLLSFSRCYSGPNYVLLVPESEKYLFDFEKSSPKEIEACIPKRPTTHENIRKHYYNIPEPSSIADLILQPDFHDTFITSLAAKKPFSGDESLKLVSNAQYTTVQQPESTAYLRFEKKTFHWINDFNKSNFALKSLADDEKIATIAYYNKFIEEKILSALASKSRDDTSVKSIYDSLNIFRNHEKKLNDSLHQSELTNMVTFDHLLLHLLRNSILPNTNQTDFLGGHVADLIELLTFIESNLTLCSYKNGILPMLELLIPYLHSNNDDSLKRDTFDRFYEKVVTLFPKAKTDLLLTNMDKLAYISFESSNIRRGSKIVKTLIKRQKVATSKRTYHSLLQFYVYESNELSKETKRASILQFMSDYKPLLFHYGIDELSFELIKPTISTYFELDHLVKFMESSNKGLLATTQTELFEILHRLQRKENSELDIIANFQASQLLRRLVVDNEIILDESTKELIKVKYPKVNETCT